ncbi:MAG: PIN domain-containing protein [Gaiellales bacterium]|nr:PIN domain-containing protein [Gaiellales bacterium]
MPFVALLDADVLYPARLRDVLLSVAEAGLYRVIWTERILDEMVRNVLDDRPDLAPNQLHHTVSCMMSAFPEAMVTGYESLENVMTNHEKDRHVLAACVRGRADVLVTCNARYFPPECCSLYDIDVQDPDEFLVHAYDLRPEAFMAAIERMLQRNQSPPRNIPGFLESSRTFTPQLVGKIRADL